MSKTEYTLISIVSGQAIPNVMPVLQDDRYFSHLEFIVSADAAKPSKYDKYFNGIYFKLKAYLESLGRVVTRRAPVHPYDMAAMMTECQSAVAHHRSKGREVVFNITGGTKLMSMAAYLCAQQHHLDVIYVESRDRCMIHLPPSVNFAKGLASNAFTSTRKPFVEARFNVIDVEAYVSLYGQKVISSITAAELKSDQAAKALAIGQHYGTVRGRLSTLQQEITKVYKESKKEKKAFPWPLKLKLKRVTKAQREAFKKLALKDVLGWDDKEHSLSCTKQQYEFLRGPWVEVFALHQLTDSGLFADVRGNVKLEGVDGEWDIMLTVNANLAILECKSNAKLSDQFGKIRAIQQNLGGPYARSFFVRSGKVDENTTKQAKLYGITQVLNFEDMAKLVEIVAKRMGI